MQFLYPGFLWGLLAVGVPIAIHLLQLRRPQRVLFTNTGFIREVELTTMQRRRVQELLVLLARVLGVIFLVLLFAQPFIPALQEGRMGGEVEVLLDASPSMQAVGESRKTLAQEAVDKAQQLGKSYPPATRFQLLAQSNAGLTQAAYLTRLLDVQEIARSAAWNKLTAQRDRQNPLYVFSDFQRSDQGVKLLQKVAATGQPIVLMPQVARQAANVYVDSVWLDDAFVRMKANIALHIRLKNGGSGAIADCPIKVRLGKQQVAAFSVSLAAGQASTTVAQVQLADKQQMLGEVVTGDSPVTFDNTYYFALQPTATIQVMEIGEAPITQQAYSAEPLFAYTFAKPQVVDYSKLQRANLVLVREATASSAGLQQALEGVMRRGGSVVIVPPGGSAGREPTLQLLRKLGVGGAQWVATAGQPVLREVAMPSPRNPFFREVFGAQPRQVALPQVVPVLNAGRGGTDILRLRDGDSYLTEFSGGAGRVYVFAAPFDKAYGDFTTQGLFVPVLYRLAMQSYQGGQQLAYRLSNPTLTVEVATDARAAGADETAFRLVHDSMTFIPAQRQRGTALQLELPATLGRPGFYELRHMGKLVTTLAFNASTKESELAAYSAAELRQLIGTGHPNVQVLEPTTGSEALLRYRAEQTGQALWRYCLLVVLACLLTEALLLRFGRPKVVARPAVAA